MQKKTITTLALSTLMAAGAQAAVISVNLAGDNDATPANIGSSEDTGVVNVSNWNDFDNRQFTTTGGGGQGLTIVDSSGTGTGVVVSHDVGTNATWNNGGFSGDAGFVALQTGRFDVNGTVNITATSIPYSRYNVYVYFGLNSTAHDFDISVQGDVNGDEVRRNNPGLLTGFDLVTSVDDAGNYALFENVTGSTLTITGDNNSNRVHFTGFQIVNSPVLPEPSSLGLMVFGTMLFVRSRSFKKASA